MPTLTSSIQHRTRSHSWSSQTRKGKDIPIGKEEVKLSLFADNMLLYTETTKNSIKKQTLRTNNKLSKVAGHKIKIQKSVAFLYTNNKLPEKKLRK